MLIKQKFNVKEKTGRMRYSNPPESKPWDSRPSAVPHLCLLEKVEHEYSRGKARSISRSYFKSPVQLNGNELIAFIFGIGLDQLDGPGNH